MKFNNKWFTLIEVIVSITILAIIMTSIFVIFILSWDLNNKTDISRAMQENIKNVVETIAEDVRKNWISWVDSDSTGCKFNFSSVKYLSWTKLCVWSGGLTQYYLAKAWTLWIVSDYATECGFWSGCVIVKKDSSGLPYPISNSWVEFRDLYFYISSDKQPKVTINFVLQPSSKKWIKPWLIKEHKINFQTTISQRLYNDY